MNALRNCAGRRVSDHIMHTVQELIENISSGSRAAHAFAVEGRASEARNSFIVTMAAGLECTSEDPAARPCGRCPACLQTAAGTSMDVVRMSKSTGASRTGREVYRVQDAAAFIERLNMGSYGRYLIGIIDDADTLSETIQNKLLKTLEEPAPDTILILAVSNRDNLLDTVLSRVSCIRLADYTGEEEPGITEEDAKASAALSNLAAMYTDMTAAFHEIRTAVDKNVRSREDALVLLDAIEDGFRERMLSISRGELSGSAGLCAQSIEYVNTARVDIRRDMNHTRALKRLYLDLI